MSGTGKAKSAKTTDVTKVSTKMTVAALKEVAAQKGIEIPSGAKKEDILKLINDHKKPAKAYSGFSYYTALL